MKGKALYVGWALIIVLVVGVSIGFIVTKLNSGKEGKRVQEVTTENDVAEPVPAPAPNYIEAEEDNIVLPEPDEEPVIVHEPNIQVGVVDNEASKENWVPTLISEISPSFQAVAGNIPIQLYIMSVEEIGDGVNEVVVGCRNTDLVCLAYTTDFVEWELYDCCNQYGSDYAIVYWYNDVPEDSQYWYDMLFDSGLYGGPYTSDYAGGDTCTFVDSNTGEQYLMVGGEG